MSQPKSESKESDFWTLDNGYKKTIKRTEDGRKMVNFLKDMIDERASVEKAYSKSLNRWYLKWMKKVDKCKFSCFLIYAFEFFFFRQYVKVI